MGESWSFSFTNSADTHVSKAIEVDHAWKIWIATGPNAYLVHHAFVVGWAGVVGHALIIHTLLICHAGCSSAHFLHALPIHAHHPCWAGYSLALVYTHTVHAFLVRSTIHIHAGVNHHTLAIHTFFVQTTDYVHAWIHHFLQAYAELAIFIRSTNNISTGWEDGHPAFCHEADLTTGTVRIRNTNGINGVA